MAGRTKRNNQTRDDGSLGTVPVCVHCGDPCGEGSVEQDGLKFCCSGCQTVYALLHESGLGTYYTLEDRPGLKPDFARKTERFAYLDRDSVRDRLLDFNDGHTARITFSVPQIHCSSCIWLLENLYRLEPAVLSSRVDFQRRTASVAFEIDKLPLSRLVALLSSIGYEPEISLSDLDRAKPDRSYRQLYGRLAVAGFAAGNVMLLSFPRYFGLEGVTGDSVSRLLDYLKIILAAAVVFYSALEYFQPALRGLKQRQLNMDVPIALGIAITFIYSIYEILVLNGAGYMDSLCALVFLLLVGRLYQKKTYFSLSFERGYRSYLPIAVMRKGAAGEECVPLDEVVLGDTLVLRHGEVIPADGILRAGGAEIDYSFVTGEAQAVRPGWNDRVFAGGRQIGGMIEIEITREPSRSYLLRLWEETEAVSSRRPNLATLAHRAGVYFTPAVLVVAVLTTAFWLIVDPSRTWFAATSVLIVACPCALALASPFALGTAQRLMGRSRFFLKDSAVVESLAQTTALVFDKTGTITQSGAAEPEFVGEPLSPVEKSAVLALVRQSSHPLSVRLRDHLNGNTLAEVTDFVEHAGKGLSATVDGREVRVGSRGFVGGPEEAGSTPNLVHVAFDGVVRGHFRFANRFRPGLREVAEELSPDMKISLLSGDHDGDRVRVGEVLGPAADLHFNQTPSDKLQFVNRMVEAGEKVVMVGDGLNDAGALKAATVGLTVVEDDAAFTPASDGVFGARSFRRLPGVLAFARGTVTVIKISFAISLVYNLIGLAFAVQGKLSPVVAAILMPASSATVVLFSTLATGYLARRKGLI